MDYENMVLTIGNRYVAWCAYAVNFPLPNIWGKCYCPLVLYAQDHYDFSGEPDTVIDFLVSRGYSERFLCGFLGGFDSHKRPEDYQDEESQAGCVLGNKVYMYCKDRDLLV